MLRTDRLPTSLALAAALALGVQAVAVAQEASNEEPASIVVTTAVLGSVVDAVVGDAAEVTVLMPSGADPHEWQPSARDVERVMEAALVVENGLDLEEGLIDVLEQARADGVDIFTAADHVEVRLSEEGHDAHADHADDAHEHADEHDHEGIAHACGHFDDDPVEVGSGGSIPDDHTRYVVALDDGSAAVTLERDEAGAVAFFLGTEVPLAATDEAGEALAAEQMMAVGDECAAVAAVATFDLAAGAYTLELGPADVSAVDLVWEGASHEGLDHAEGHDHAESEEHAEGEEHADEHMHEDEDADHEDAHGHGPEDPHLWLDPVAMGSVVDAMVPAMAELGIDVEDGAAAFEAELVALDAEIEAMIATIPEDQRKLVTGHEALGYFVDRYGLEQIGAVLPSLSTSGEPSARDIAELIETMEAAGVSVVFTDIGAPASLVQAVAEATGADVVPVNDAQLPDDGSYVSLMRELAQAITRALAG